MKTISMLFLATLAVLALNFMGGAGEEEMTPLQKYMDGMKTNLKPLGRAAGDPEKLEDSLRYVSELQRLVVLSKLEAPANLDEIPAEQQVAHRMAYRRDMAAVLKELAEMEIDLLEGKHEEAAKRVRGSLLPARKEGHRKYQKEEEE